MAKSGPASFSLVYAAGGVFFGFFFSWDSALPRHRPASTTQLQPTSNFRFMSAPQVSRTMIDPTMVYVFRPQCKERANQAESEILLASVLGQADNRASKTDQGESGTQRCAAMMQIRCSGCNAKLA